MCTGWNARTDDPPAPCIITYWEMCTGWNVTWNDPADMGIITYWEMCTGWNSEVVFLNIK